MVRRSGQHGHAVLQLDAAYQYDAFGNRTEKSVDSDGSGGGAAVATKFAYDQWNPAKGSPIGTENADIWGDFTAGGSLTTRYVRGDDVDQLLARIDGSTARWYVTDHLGSIRKVLDNGGVVKDAITYDAWGNILTETDTAERGRYAWTSREIDVETGLQYNRARYYDATTGRWISQDPLGFDAGDSNLYRYVRNSPTYGADPSGKVFVTSAANEQSANDFVKDLKAVGAKNVQLIKVGDLIYVHTDERDRKAIFKQTHHTFWRT